MWSRRRDLLCLLTSISFLILSITVAPTTSICNGYDYEGLDGTGNCAPCNPTCNRCDPDVSLCTECIDSTQGPFTDGTGECGACSNATNPNICGYCGISGPGACDACSGTSTQGYVPSGSPRVCQPCAVGCAGCQSSGAGLCDTCYPGTGIDGTPFNGTVSPPAGCTTCSVANCEQCYNKYNVCEICNADYVVDYNLNKCISTASTVTTPPETTTVPVTCPACPDPYQGWNTSLGACQDCQATCFYCTPCQSLCSQCNIATEGPVLDGSGSCGPCDANCGDCSISGAGNCDTCAEVDGQGYVATGSPPKCQPCATKCPACQSSGAGGCDACLGGTGRNSDPVFVPGTPTTPPQGCSACDVPNCIQCFSNFSQCEVCETGYSVSDDNSMCIGSSTVVSTETSTPISTTVETTLTTTTEVTSTPTSTEVTSTPITTTEITSTPKTTTEITSVPTTTTGTTGPPNCNNTLPNCDPLLGYYSPYYGWDLLNQCELCDPTCAECYPCVGQCTLCNDATFGPFYDGSGDCGACSNVTNPDICGGCDTYGPGTCDVCSSTSTQGYVASGSPPVCQPCATGCAGCQSSGAGLCDTCYPGTGIDGTPFNGTVKPPTGCTNCSVANCQQCYNNYTVCEICNADYIADYTLNECISTISTTEISSTTIETTPTTTIETSKKKKVPTATLR